MARVSVLIERTDKKERKKTYTKPILKDVLKC